MGHNGGYAYSGRKHILSDHGDDICGISRLHGSHIRVGGIGNNLYSGLTGIEIVRETFAKDYCHINVTAPEKAFCFFGRMQTVDNGKVLTDIHTVNYASGYGIIGRVENGHTHIPYFRSDGKAEKDYLHNGHTQQNQHRAPVAEDVKEFFSDKSYELFHGYITICFEFYICISLPFLQPHEPTVGTHRPWYRLQTAVSVCRECQAHGLRRPP